MADETTPTPPPTTSPAGFFSKPPQRPGTVPPIRSVARPPLAPRPEPAATADAEPLGSTEPHPWMRYFARMTDVVVFSLSTGIVIGLLAPILIKSVNGMLLGVLIVFAWIFMESVLLATWGTTPGKWLFGITVRTRSGSKLDGGAALGRSFAVWLRGLGLGLPIVSLVTLIMAYNRLKASGETSWDAAGGFEVTHRPLSGGRMALLIVVAVLCVVFALIGALTS